MKNASLHKRDRKRGAILIIVLWISTGLVAISLLFGQSMMLSYRAGENTLAGIQAEQAIEGALRYIEYALRNGDYGEFDPEETFRTSSVTVDQARFWMIGRDDEYDDNDYPAFGLLDESSKLNLNTATVDMLEKLPNMTPEFAAAIIDWRDEDDDISENGAESETYGLRQPSFESKNAPFETIEELHLIQYSDWEIIYGEDANQNGFMDWNEQDGSASLPLDDQDQTLLAGLMDFVTVYSRQSNLNDEGEAKININGDSTEELNALLEETFGSERAGELMGVTAGNQEFTSMLTFFQQSGMTADEFGQIDHELSLSDDPYTEGLVNINTARLEVLLCLPGMDEDQANQLIQYRISNPDSLTSVAWITEVLEQNTLSSIGEWITAQSYQYTADLCAVGHDGKGFRRVKYVVDYHGGVPVVRYRKDMTRLGWALGTLIQEEQRMLKESGNEYL